MAFEPFFDEVLGQELLEMTDAVRVTYRGQECWMHMEVATTEMMERFAATIGGVARILIGQTSFFGVDVERGTLITAGGEDYVIGDFVTGEDGEVIYLALTKSLRS